MIGPQILQMGSGMGGGWWSGAFFGPLIALLLVGAILFVLWNAMSEQDTGQKRSTQPNDAMETLRERYARGEIDDETFEERARKLRDK